MPPSPPERMSTREPTSTGTQAATTANPHADASAGDSEHGPTHAHSSYRGLPCAGSDKASAASISASASASTSAAASLAAEAGDPRPSGGRRALAYANELARSGERLSHTENLQSTRPLLRLLAAIISVPMTVEGLIGEISEPYFWSWLWVSFSALLAGACIWRRNHWSSELFAFGFGWCLVNANIAAAGLVTRGETVCCFVVVLLWTGVFVRLRWNVILAAYALAGYHFFGASDQWTSPWSSEGGLPLGFTLLFVAFPVAVGAGLRFDERRSSMELARSLDELREKRDELEILCAEQSARVDRSHAQLLRGQRLQAVGTMASGLAHELNNILTPIRGLAELMTEGVSSQQAARYGASILDSAIAAAQITGALLTYSRQGTYSPVRTELGPLLELEIVPLVASAVPAPIVLEHRLAAGVCAEVDRSLLQNCIHQLVLNAVDALRDDSGELDSGYADAGETKTISIELMRSVIECSEGAETDIDQLTAGDDPDGRPALSAVIVVRDNGSGIPEDTLPQIFDPFFTTKRVGSGAGLGLPMVHGTITRHGGRVVVNSEAGLGTTVVLQLPLADVEVSATQTRDHEDSARPLPVVYIMSDDEDFLDEVGELMEDARYQTRPTTDLDQLCAQLSERHEQPAMVLLDMDFVQHDPRAAFETLRTSHPRLPIALVSERTADAKMRDLARRGPTRTVRKPIDRDLILPVLAMLAHPPSDSGESSP